MGRCSAHTTSGEIAEAAGLTERHVREWLDVTIISEIIDCMPETRRYLLLPGHAASLAREDSLGNLAVYAGHEALLGRTG